MRFVSISALLMTVLVLATQNRQDGLAEQRHHLDLQINLLTERKVSKVIEMLAALQQELPSTKMGVNPEAEVMKEPVDPLGNNLLVVRMGHYDCIKVEYSIS